MPPESFTPNRFKDKAAIVTGSGQGIGFATVLRFELEGARIVIADLAEESAAAAVKELALRGIEGKLTPWAALLGGD